MQKMLDALASSGGKPIETLTPEAARKQMTVKGPAGDFPVHIYTPEGKGPLHA